MNNIQEILENIWINEIKELFKEGKIINESQLQAYLFYFLKHKYEKYQVWLEPVLYVNNLKLNKTRPDLIITEDDIIIAIIELKFKPWEEPKHENDIAKLNELLKLKETNEFIILNWLPCSENWQIQKNNNTLKYKISENLTCFFMVIGHPRSIAIKTNIINGINNITHLIGYIEERNELDKIIFKLSKHE